MSAESRALTDILIPDSLQASPPLSVTRCPPTMAMRCARPTPGTGINR